MWVKTRLVVVVHLSIICLRTGQPRLTC